MTTTWNPADKHADVTLSGGDLIATVPGISNWHPARSTADGAKSTDKWYYEVTLGAGTECFIGIGTSSQSIALGTYPGNSVESWGYYSTTGGVFHSGASSGARATWTTGDVIGVAYDGTADTVSFYKNGSLEGAAETGVTGTFYPMVSLFNSASVTANFGASTWAYDPPSGYVGYDAGPPTPGTVAVTMTAMTAYAARIASVAVTMEPMTSAGAFNGFGDADMVAMTMSASGGNSSAAVNMTAMTSAATGRQEHRVIVDMAAMTAAATGYDSSINTVAATVPAITLSSAGYAGEVITFAGTVPAITLECHTKDVRVTLPAPTLSATLLSGTIITVEAGVAAPILVATLDNPAIITVASSVPPVRLSATLLPGALATAALTLRSPTLSAQILTGNVATVLATVAAPIMEAAGYPAYTITFAGTVPALRLTATLSAAVTAAFRTWTLNLKKGALTEYGSEWAMNSYCVFNGVVLGCTSSGIVELGTQALDNATAISSTVKSGADNFGTSVIKRLPRAYIDYTTGGDARFALITTEGGRRVYALNWNNVTGSQQRRVPIGKGPKSVRWQWEYTNVDGADFDLGAVLAYPSVLRRRVQ